MLENWIKSHISVCNHSIKVYSLVEGVEWMCDKNNFNIFEKIIRIYYIFGVCKRCYAWNVCQIHIWFQSDKNSFVLFCFIKLPL